MDKKYIEENEIEIKYLRNQLTPEELEEFEVYLMDNPEVVEWLMLDELMIQDSGKSPKNIKQALMAWSSQKRNLLKGIFPIVSHLAALLAGIVVFSNLETSPAVLSEVGYISPSRSVSGDVVGPTFSFPKSSFGEKQTSQLILVLEGFTYSNESSTLSICKKSETSSTYEIERVIKGLRENSNSEHVVMLDVSEIGTGEFKIDLQSSKIEDIDCSGVSFRVKDK